MKVFFIGGRSKSKDKQNEKKRGRRKIYSECKNTAKQKEQQLDAIDWLVQ